MSTDTRLTRLADLREASREVYEGYEAIVREVLDENADMSARLDEVRQLLREAFDRPQVVRVEPPAKKKAKTVLKACERCHVESEISITARFCKECWRIQAGEHSRAYRASQLAAVS